MDSNFDDGFRFSVTNIPYLLNKTIKLKPHKFTFGTFLFEHCPVIAYTKQRINKIDQVK